MRKHLKWSFILSCFGISLALMTDRALAYTFTTIDYPGAKGTLASGINTSGNIVGWYTDVTDKNHGFLYAGGTFTTINVPGATATYALG
jgi:probable HAF family extracellular repeat protein